MDGLKLEPINIGSDDYSSFNDIFCESFRPYDRPSSLGKLIELCNMSPNTFVMGAYDGETPVGIVNYTSFDSFIYLMYFCVNSNIRSKGYGSRLLKALITEYPSHEIIACGEIENKNEDKTAQNAARKKFYERNGFVYTKYTYWENNMQFAVMTNGMANNVPSYIGTILKEAGGFLSEEEVAGFSKIAKNTSD